MEKVLRGSKGFSARLRLASEGVVGCATVTAVVKHLFLQCNVLQSMQSMQLSLLVINQLDMQMEIGQMAMHCISYQYAVHI